MTNSSLIPLFRTSLTHSVQTAAADLSTRPWEVQQEDDPGPTRLETDPLTVAITFAGHLAGNLFFTLERDQAAFLHGPASAVAVDAAWLSTAQTIAGQLCRALSEVAGPISIADCRVQPSSSQEGHSLGAVVLRSHDEITAITIAVSVDDVLLRHLRQPGATTMAPAAPDLPRPATMDRVIDVQLAVTMRFGQRQLTLRELLDLSTGSLLELDRQVEEPVDLMLEDRVIARGEVVIVDGNYGMRITEVLEHAARTAARERPQPLTYVRA